MKRYIITSAQAHAKPHLKFWASVQNYAKKNEAEIIVLPMIGSSAREDWDEVDSAFTDYLLYKKRELNTNIAIEQFNVRPYQVDPLTGLNRFAQQGQSLIFASPKQRLRPIPHSNQKYPRFLITTGAVTRPNYATSSDVSAERRRLGSIARRDHVYGAVIVEVENNKVYHFRHIRANRKGEFVDFGVRYNGNTEPAALEAMVLGDWHSGQTDPEIRIATIKMIADLKPQRLILHDFFDGHSVSHWVMKKPVREFLLQIYDKNMGFLEGELRHAYEDLKLFANLVPEVVVVYSNHHAFLPRYLEEFRFTHEIHNLRIATKLLSYMAEKDYNDPVEAGIRMFGDLPNVNFLRPDEDYKVHGFQLGAHGDKSDSGMGYGNMTTKEQAWGKSCSGHVHKAQILRNTYTVGTCLPLNMFYMRGNPTDWTHSHALLWDDGNIQLVSIIDGKWRAT